MSKNDSTYQLIEDYLNNRLTEEQARDVESRIEIDFNFKKYFEEHKIANEVIVLAEIAQIKSKLAKVHLQDKKSVLLKKIIIALSVATLLVVGVCFLFKNFNKEIIKKLVKIEYPTKVKERKEVQIIKQDSKIEKNEVTSNAIINNEVKEIVKINQNHSDSIKSILNSIHPDTLEAKTINLLDENLNLNAQPVIKNLDALEKAEGNNQTVVNVPCEDYEIESEIVISPSCENKREGKITVKSKSDDYSYSINDGKTKVKTGVFKKLKSSEYELLAFDSKGCKSLPISITVESIICDLIIQPSQQIYWEIPLNLFDDDRVILEIYSAKSGQQVYKRALDKFSNEVWNGEGLNGNSLPMGNYVYLLTSSNKNIKGSITIVR